MSTKTKAKKTKSVFGVLLVILLLLLIALTVTSNVIFSGDSVPMVAGQYLYLNESAEMEPDIPQNSLIIAKEAPASSAAETSSIAQGNKVLCYLADGRLVPRVIFDMGTDVNGDTVYYPGTPATEADTLSIPRSSIIALCSWASPELYTFVSFTTSVAGLMACLVVPCIILIVLLLVKIARSSKDDAESFEAEDFNFEQPEPTVKKPAAPTNEPLYDPEKAVKSTSSSESLEKKKSSISENFSAKPVNENSPYQKAVQERTMKFRKIQQEDVDRVKDEAKSKPQNDKAETQVFTTSKGEQKRAAELAPAPAPKKPELKKEEAPVKELDEQAKSVDVELKKDEAPVETKPAAEIETKVEEKRAEAAPEPKPVERKSSTPNIDDILSAAELRSSIRSKTSTSNSPIASTGSIDDLIAALESEKKKL